VIEVEPVVIREKHVPVEVRLWAQRPNYLAVINDERDVKFLEPYIGQTVTLKIDNIYVSGTLIKVKHGRKHELEVVLPKRLAPTWEMLRRRSIKHDAVVIIRLENEEEEVVEP
jgi:hypothetical protein